MTLLSVIEEENMTEARKISLPCFWGSQESLFYCGAKLLEFWEAFFPCICEDLDGEMKN
jgi:hypothetical protein